MSRETCGVRRGGPDRIAIHGVRRPHAVDLDPVGLAAGAFFIAFSAFRASRSANGAGAVE